MIKLLIADDHTFVRESLHELFSATEDIRVVATCADGSEVVDAAVRTDPDVVLLDVAMPRMTGLEAARALLDHRPHQRVVMLSGSITFSSVCEASALGAKGFLLKGDDPTALPEKIRLVAAGDSVWSAEATVHLSTR